jgi:hypothetical protein
MKTKECSCGIDKKGRVYQILCKLPIIRIDDTRKNNRQKGDEDKQEHGS